MTARIMVVDDMAIVREPIAASLNDAGFEVKQAGNGREALLMLKDWVPDVILLDLAMPEVDGLTFLGMIRERPALKKIPVILLTAVSDRPAVQKAALLGVRDYLLKSSFSLKDMLARVKKYVDQSTSTAPSAPTPTTATAPTAHAPAKTTAAPAEHVPQPVAAAAPIKPAHVKTEPRVVSTAPAIPPHTASGEAEKLVLLSREQTQARLSEIASVRTCAGIVARVSSLASSPHTDVMDIVRVIEADPVLTARILQLANSAAFRSKYSRLSGIEDAVRKIGMRAIQNLTISVGIFDAFPPDAADGFNTMRCWQHCFAVSAIMRMLLAGWADEDRERGALVGLCHELGEIVLRQYFAAEYELILAHAETTHQPRPAVELTALSMRHGDLVGEVLTRIGLPSNITLPIMRFHDGGVMGISADDSKIVKTMQFAEWMANGMLLAISADSRLGPINRADLRRLCGDAQMPDLQMLRSEVLSTTNFLARLPAADEAKFMRPLRPRQELNIWYARHQSYAEADPFATAFDLFGNVHTDTRLPNADEVEMYDAFILASPVPETGPLTTAGVDELAASPGYHDQPVFAFCGIPGATPVAGIHCAPLPTTIQQLSHCMDLAGTTRATARKQEAAG